MYRTRDWRRSQRNRWIQRVAHYEKHRLYYLPNPTHAISTWVDNKGIKRFNNTWKDIFDLRYKVAVRSADNRCCCSSYCCGNPRKWYGELTIQERRHGVSWQDVLTMAKNPV